MVIGVGGYSSGPVLALAALRGIPTMLMEQNAVPGLTNRLLAPVVGAAAVTYDESAAFFGSKAFVAGNPVRPEFFEKDDDRSTSAPPQVAHGQVLVFGGSQGAHAINVAMVEAAPRLAAAGPAWRSRIRPASAISTWCEGLRRPGSQARVEPFLFAMDREMKARRSRRLPRGRDDAGGTDGGRAAIDPGAAADRDRRSSAQERAGAGAKQGRRG